jgi:hypothetical protein
MRLAILLMTLAVLGPMSARADTDQRCLSHCVTSGLGGAACLKQCSYNLETKPVPPAISAVTMQDLEAHRELAVPLPDTGEIIPKPHKQAVAIPQRDRVCVSACLHAGFQYGLCNEKCVKTVCPPNVVLCKKDQTSFFLPVTQTESPKN